MVPPLVLFAWLAISRVSLGFTFNLDAESISECGSTTLTWQGGQPPFALMILSAYGTTDNITVPDSAWSGETNSGTLSWNVNYSNGTEFLAVMSDSTGFGTGGASPMYTVSSAQNAASCQVKEQSGTGVAFRLNTTSISQCQPVNVQWLSPWTHKVIAAVAGGQVTQLGSEDGDSKGLVWLPNVSSGSRVVIAGYNDYRRPGGRPGGPGGFGGGPPHWGGGHGWGGGKDDHKRGSIDIQSLGPRQGWGGGSGITSMAFTIGDGPSECLNGNSTSPTSSKSPQKPTTISASPSPTESDGSPAELSSISASIDPTLDLSASEDDEDGLSTGAMIGISAGAVAIISAALAVILFCCLKRRRRATSAAPVGGARELKGDQIDLLYPSPSNTPQTASFHNPYDTQTQTRQTTSIGQTTSMGHTTSIGHTTTGYRTDQFEPTRTYQSAYSGFSQTLNAPHSPYEDEPSPDTSPTIRHVNVRPAPGRLARIDTAMLYPPVSGALGPIQESRGNSRDQPHFASPVDQLSPQAASGYPQPQAQTHPGLSTPIFGNSAVCPSPILPAPHPFASAFGPKNRNRGNLPNRRVSQYSALTASPSSDEEDEPTKIATWTVQNPSQVSIHTPAFGGNDGPPSRPVSGGLLLHQDAGRVRPDEDEEPAGMEELPPTYRHEWERMSGRRV